MIVISTICCAIVGAALATKGIGYSDWQFWVILICVAIQYAFLKVKENV